MSMTPSLRAHVEDLNHSYDLIPFKACKLLIAVDQTVYEGGDGFPENLKTDDDLLRKKVISSSANID